MYISSYTLCDNSSMFCPNASWEGTWMHILKALYQGHKCKSPYRLGTQQILWYGQTNRNWVVVLNMNFSFPYFGNFIIPINSHIFFTGVGIPPASKKYRIFHISRFCGILWHMYTISGDLFISIEIYQK